LKSILRARNCSSLQNKALFEDASDTDQAIRDNRSDSLTIPSAIAGTHA